MIIGLRRTHHAWWLLAAACLALLLLGGARQAFGVLYKPIADDTGWSRVGLAWAATIGQFVLAGGSLAAGMAIDRYRPRLIIPIFGFLHLLGYLTMARATHLWQADLGFGLFESLAFGVAVGPFLSITSRWFHRRQGLALAIVSSAIPVGSIIIAPLTALLIDAMGWRWTLVVLGVVPATVMLAVAPLIHSRPEDVGLLPYGASSIAAGPAHGNANQPQHPPAWGLLKRLARDPRMWLICLVYGTVNISIGVVFYHVVAYASDRGLTSLAAAGLLSALNMSSIAGRFTGGLLVGRLGIHRLLIASVVGIALVTGLLPLASGVVGLYGLAASYGLFMGLSIVLVPVVCDAVFGREVLGTVVGVLILALNVGGGVGAILGGLVFDRTGSYGVAFALGAATAALAAIAAVRMRLPEAGRSAALEPAPR